MSHDEQRQLSDLIGHGTFMEAMGLDFAELYVMQTLIGRVVRGSGQQYFEAELQSLK